MSPLAFALVQVAVVLAVSPVVVGILRQIGSLLEGRRGAGIWQPFRDLKKLLGKQTILPEGTTAVFLWAPLTLMGTTLLIAAVTPLVNVGSPLDASADFIAIVGLLFIGTVALALAGLDTGTAFGGMGSSRQITIVALVEPTILLVLFTLSLPAQSANLSAMVIAVLEEPEQALSLGRILAFASFVIVILAEAGRFPVDNPSTHLELTMIHEAMTLEYTGQRLALVEWASGMRLTILLALLANLFVPWGIAGVEPTLVSTGIAVVVLLLKIVFLAALLAIGETFLAKLRLFRVPELLAGSLLLAFLAVTAGSFLAPVAT